jgi:hypothetical protein
MKKLILFIALISIYTNTSIAQSSIVVTRKIGSYNVYYAGYLTWYEADEKAKQIGYSLPSPEEFSNLIGGMSMDGGVMAEAKNRGYKHVGQHVWTSKDEGSTWKCDKKCAYAMWNDRLREDRTIDKELKCSAWLVKKLK